MLSLGEQSYEDPEFIEISAYGRVYRARRPKDLEVVAVKELELARFPGDEWVYYREGVEKGFLFDHPHILPYYNFVYDGTRALVEMEYCSGGSLSEFIRLHRKSKREGIDELSIWAVATQLANALAYLHTTFREGIPVVHRDVKPENILFTSTGVLKLCDFGRASFLDGSPINRLTGTLFYMAPEIAQEKEYGSEVDIWSLGCVLYEMCGGDIITFHGAELTHDPYIDFGRYSEGLNQLIRNCLRYEPQQRITAGEIMSLPEARLALETTISMGATSIPTSPPSYRAISPALR
ncbi:Kinase, NEK [Giardia muris]|uniref:non-specific serine/threonine protein kinase n=1 Tax=Giardia muris TaxID=5742 RepID=A0A4Z1SVT7_GIAMU|nr:Kinase, NEK [Giardia muris]|eukprot:TNJ29886.1 Kinase, NEK [Giardia muris]